MIKRKKMSDEPIGRVKIVKDFLPPVIMKTRKFQKYLEKRLDEHEIAEIEKHALAEVQNMQLLQKTIAHEGKEPQLTLKNRK